MKKEKTMQIYIVVDPYTPDTGDTIYGVYSSKEKADKRIEELSASDNEYDENMNYDNTINILIETVE